MRRDSQWTAAVVVIAGLLLGGCASSSQAGSPPAEKPAKVSAVDGTEAKKVVLTEPAVTRLGIQTAAVAAATVTGADGKPAARTTVPYSALIYDTKGATWVFEQVEPRSFLRKRVDIEIVSGETVVMTTGPPAGTTIVTVGAAPLYGTELGTGS